MSTIFVIKISLFCIETVLSVNGVTYSMFRWKVS